MRTQATHFSLVIMITNFHEGAEGRHRPGDDHLRLASRPFDRLAGRCTTADAKPDLAPERSRRCGHG
jgi:hypothetical protein